MKYMTLIGLVLLSTSAVAGDYKTEQYDTYGYGAAASSMQGSGLKAGVRGQHTESRKEDLYYPGYTTGEANHVAQWMGKR